MNRGANEPGSQQGLLVINETSNAVLTWSEEQFGSGRQLPMLEQRLLGALEEVGELSHAVLKMQQKIRGSTEKHLVDMRDALGDICIYLADYCGRSGLSMRDAYAKSLDLQLTGPGIADTDQEHWLRCMCMQLATCIAGAFGGVGSSAKPAKESHVVEVLRLCESISYEIHGEPIWQVMSSVWVEVVAKREWKKTNLNT